MSLSEFSLIKKYFTQQRVKRDDVTLGIGDDAALLTVPADTDLVVAIDTLVEGRHFPVGTSPDAIAHKLLAVNLSDMAAMGATPAWMTLSLALPESSHDFLNAFSRGLLKLAEQFDVQLVGGDTVRGPLCVSAQLHGFVPVGKAMRRSGAKPGDKIYVTGTLGDAGAGLALAQNKIRVSPEAHNYLTGRLERPSPRVAEGILLRDVASAAIDISDGVIGDLGHILSASGVGATINADELPLSDHLYNSIESIEERRLFALSAGDDYELCFCVPAEKSALFQETRLACRVTCIGTIEKECGLRVRDSDGECIEVTDRGFDHFADD